jgi:uncharacterized protein
MVMINCFSVTRMRKYFFLFVFLLPVISLAQKAVPELWGLHVHDDAHVLSKPVVDELEAKLVAFRDSTSNEIAVLIIPTLDGEIIEEYSLRVAEKWALGDKEKDNGALLLIAVDDHKMRIETGQGLEGVLTDAVCNRIIRNELAPNFRANDYDDGVKQGIDAMIKAIGGEYTSDDTAATNDDFIAPEMTWQERLMIGAFVFGILGIFTLVGLMVSGCAGWFLYAFLIPFYATFPMFILPSNGGVIALICYVIGFPILKLIIGRSAWGKKMAKKMGSGNRSGGSGWSSGSGWSGGSWGGGGSSSGGFSGGGGSFGGGGSSGSW